MNTAEAHTDAAWFGLARELTKYPVVARFTVEGEPESKSRVRFDARNRRTYTPERTVLAERTMAWRFREVARGYTPDPGKSYGVVGLFFAATRQRRDVDNMLKLICDALNGLAWVDDNQVLEVAGRKAYVDNKAHARTEVLIYELPPVRQRTSPCAHCGKPLQTYPSWRGIRRFCSPACRSAAMTKPPKPCAACGKDTPNRRKYCSTDCQRHGGRITQQCAQCGADVERYTSWAKNGRPFCGHECRATYWRAHRAAVARGTCVVCGGPTSKKTYLRCRCCVIEGASRREAP